MTDVGQKLIEHPPVASEETEVHVGGSLHLLTGTQRACLELAAEHMSSKDIAKKLGSSPHTVDNHIKAALMRLGLPSRREAARMIRAQVTQVDRRELASQSKAISVVGPAGAQPVLPDEEIEVRRGTDVSDQIGNEGYAGQAVVGQRSAPRLPFPKYWGEENRMSAVQKALWVLVLGVAICIGIGSVLAAMEALSRIV